MTGVDMFFDGFEDTGCQLHSRLDRGCAARGVVEPGLAESFVARLAPNRGDATEGEGSSGRRPAPCRGVSHASGVDGFGASWGRREGCWCDIRLIDSWTVACQTGPGLKTGMPHSSLPMNSFSASLTGAMTVAARLSRKKRSTPTSLR